MYFGRDSAGWLGEDDGWSRNGPDVKLVCDQEESRGEEVIALLGRDSTWVAQCRIVDLKPRQTHADSDALLGYAVDIRMLLSEF